jgi:hypothetical protein
MKKVLFLLVALISLGANAQTSTDSTKTVGSKNLFVSVGLSTSQGDFATNSYPSIELGYTHENISYSAVFGRGDFNGVFRNDDNLGNYWFEAKFSPSYSVGPLNGFLIAGGGAYFNSNHYFAELGAGLSYTHNRFTYGAAFSNWDTKNYVTPFISVNF